MRADRLISILMLIQNYGKMTSRELAQKLEVSERTIFRDMEALSAAGIPVYAERGSSGGWSLSEGYQTSLTGLKSEEILTLLWAAPDQKLNDLGIQGNFQSAIQKLVAAAPKKIQQEVERVQQRIHIDGAGWHQSKETFPLLAAVQEAVWKEQKLRIHYQRNEDVVERVVAPLGLVAKRSIWYMIAEIEGELRTYRISRFVKADLLEGHFARPADFDLAQYWEQSTKQFTQNLPRYPAKLNVDMKLLPRLEQERYVQILHTEMLSNDGWTVAAVQFETKDSACEIVLSFGALVEVLEPVELRSQVAAAAQAIVQLYCR